MGRDEDDVPGSLSYRLRPYDVIAKIQAPSLDQLGRLVVSRIQVVDGVTRTLTCTVIRR